MNLKGKNVLVTGIASNRSISYAIAKILHENGANVIVSYQNDRLKERVIKLKNQLKHRLMHISVIYQKIVK
jgi:enoyl-[acyl-carrier protein] reductase I